jgi:hypothetical protein
VEEDEFEYEQDFYDAVDRCRILLRIMKGYQLEIGELADGLVVKYRERTLYDFAAQIGVDYETLKTYRTTWRHWKDESEVPPFAIARVLNRHPDKQEIWQEIKDTEYESVQGAREKMREWREERGADKKSKKAMSVNAIHKRKTLIIRELNKFLSERSDLRTMILELNERDVTDFYYVDEIVDALVEAAKRIRKTIDELKIIQPVK